MIASPTDYTELDVEDEWKKLRDSLDDLEKSGKAEVTRLQCATLSELQKELRRQDFHVFHFIGHGGFDAHHADGVLLLEDENGKSRPVSGQHIGMMLHDAKTLRLAILNACEGARTSRSDPFTGVAQTFIQQGVPAVIAMQFEISDDAAISLTHEFYAALADGFPVDAALAEGRKSIFAEVNDVEWGTPVLYTGAHDGHIFDIDVSSSKVGATFSRR